MPQEPQPPIEAGEIRRQLRHLIDKSKRDAAAHRAQASEASTAFEPLLDKVAVPVFRQFAVALRGEGLQFRVLTPARSVRIEAERSGDNFLELRLDTERRPVAVVLRRGYTRGSRAFEDERVLHQGSDLEAVTPALLLDALLEDVVPFVER